MAGRRRGLSLAPEEVGSGRVGPHGDKSAYGLQVHPRRKACTHGRSAGVVRISATSLLSQEEEVACAIHSKKVASAIRFTPVNTSEDQRTRP